MKNYYEILEVNEKASQEIINKVFKMHIKKWHPDLYTSEDKLKAENKTKELNEAYSVLSNEQKRAEYDKELEQQKIYSIESLEIEALRQENEQLKIDIENRNILINKLINSSKNITKNVHYYDENEYSDFQTSKNLYKNDKDYNNQNENYTNSDIIYFFVKIIICFFMLFIGAVLVFFIVENAPNYNIF